MIIQNLYKLLLGLFLIVWSLIFLILKTNYFGGSLLPNSLEEVVCIITAALMFLGGYILARDSFKRDRFWK